MITTGVIGQQWRASVTPWGDIEPWDGTPGLGWYVAADDRWHVPSQETTVRQQRIDGTSVVETRVRIPNGDAVQRIYSVADGGGCTVVEILNESTMPIAVAFDRRDVLTDRPPSDAPIQGMELPEGSFVVPIGHQATARVAIPHDGSGSGILPANLPSAMHVARGWSTVTGRASRLVLPDASSALAVTAERCELALGSMAHAGEDPVAFILALGELARMGEQLDPWMPELVEAVELAAPRQGWDVAAALDAAARVLHAAGERRGRRDLQRIVERRTPDPADPSEAPTGVRLVAWTERRLALGGALLPVGFPVSWLGANIEVYGVPIGVASTVSFAVRWHGERPALLWEVTGEPVTLSAPAIDPHWQTTEPTGEALWAVPATAGDVSFS